MFHQVIFYNLFPFKIDVNLKENDHMIYNDRIPFDNTDNCIINMESAI